MGWKGTVRSIGVAYRAAERDAKRRQRELERQNNRGQTTVYLKETKRVRLD